MDDKDRIYKMLAKELRKATTEEDLKNLNEEVKRWFENSDETDSIPQINIMITNLHGYPWVKQRGYEFE